MKNNDIVNRIICADVIDGLKQIPDETVSLVFTSPPYNTSIKYGEHLDEMPWGELSIVAQEMIVVCEGDEFDDEDENGGIYYDCLDNSTASACSEQSGCTWFDTFCGDENYDPNAGPDNACVGADEASCTSVDNCYWQSDSSYCYYDSTGGSGSSTSVPTTCFYSNATINGEAPGYTVWCESNYVNCRVGDESGDPVSSEGLVLGEPSSCYTSSGSSSDNSNSSFLASVAAVFSSLIQGFQNLLGF